MVWLNFRFDLVPYHTDINECSTGEDLEFQLAMSNDQESVIGCVDTPGDYYCQCIKGFVRISGSRLCQSKLLIVCI